MCVIGFDMNDKWWRPKVKLLLISIGAVSKNVTQILKITILENYVNLLPPQKTGFNKLHIVSQTNSWVTLTHHIKLAIAYFIFLR